MAIRKVIAEIKLAPGQVGFYDPLTNIHLTITYPFGTVYSGMNTTNLLRSVKSKRLVLLSGSLSPTIIKKDVDTQKVTYSAKASNEVETASVEVKTEIESKAKAIQEEVIEKVKAATVEAEVAEVAVEEVKEEAPKAKKKSSKKAKAETEEAGE